MAYEDMLSTFKFLHRTRLFDERWTVVQHWTSVNVGWVTGYLQTKFLVEIKKAGPVVFVLCQVCCFSRGFLFRHAADDRFDEKRLKFVCSFTLNDVLTKLK
jgi:hypothetical protein